MKTILKKFAAILLALTMLLSVVPLSVAAADYPTIALDEEVVVTLDGVDVTEAVYAFTPHRGRYVFILFV